MPRRPILKDPEPEPEFVEEAPKDVETGEYVEDDFSTIPQEEPDGAPEFKEEAPKPVFARQDASEVLGTVWSGVGQLMVRYGTVHEKAPGRIMALQGPVAGRKLDRLIAGTFVDKYVQKAVGLRGAFDEISGLALAPIMAEIISRSNGAMFEALAPKLIDALLPTLDELVPILKKEKSQQDKTIRNLAGLAEVFEVPEGVDPRSVLLQYLFQEQTGEAQQDATIPTMEGEMVDAQDIL